MKISAQVIDYDNDIFSLCEDIQIYCSLGIKMEIEFQNTRNIRKMFGEGIWELYIPTQTIEAENINYLKELCS